MAKRFILLSLIGFALGLGLVVQADETTVAENEAETAALTKLAFPIAALDNCASKEACRAYCNDPDHSVACLKFAEENGLMSKTKVAQARQALGRPGPGNCRGEACKVFCAQEKNFEVCLKFGIENGFIKAEEAERARQFKRLTGPSNCRGEACRAYCGDPAHREECYKFARENNLISKEALQKQKQEQGRLADSLRRLPPELQECLKAKRGENFAEGIETSQAGLDPKLGEEMRTCFQSFNQQRRAEFDERHEENTEIINERLEKEKLLRPQRDEELKRPRGELFKEQAERKRQEGSRLEFQRTNADKPTPPPIKRLEEPNIDRPGPTHEFEAPVRPLPTRSPLNNTAPTPSSWLNSAQARLLEALWNLLK